MSNSFNRVILVGNVGRDPEYTVLPSGDQLARISLATNRTWKDNAGVKKDKTTWHRVIADGKRFERVLPWIKKGVRILVEGEIDNRQYVDQAGQTRYTTDIRAVNIQLMGSANGNANGGSADTEAAGSAGGQNEPPAEFDTRAGATTRQAAGQVPQGNTRPATSQVPQGTQPAVTPSPAAGGPDEFTDFGDDIPF